MNTRKALHLVLYVAVIVSLCLPAVGNAAAVIPPASGSAALAAPAGPAQPDTGLFRTRITVNNPTGWERLDALGVVILERGDDSALALVDDEQLETLARLRFEPRASDEIGELVRAQDASRAWLLASMQPLLDQGVAVQAQIEAKASAEAVQAARETLRGAMAALTPEQRAGLVRSFSVDDDGGDELTQLTGPRPAIANLRVSNVSDTSFTVSWTTNVPTTGYVHYGASEALGQLAYDERGSTTIDDTHHVKLENLPPGATIYFDVLAGQAIDDNGGAHYSVTTGVTLPPPGSDTIYGRVFKPDGVTLAGGAMVYARACDANGQGSPGCSDWLSALVAPGNGFWYTNLGQARNESHNAYFSYSPAGDRLEMAVEGAADCRAALTVDTANDSPAADIVLRCTVQASMASSPGWNLVALPLQPMTPHLAQSLLDLINSQGGQCSEIDRWRFGGWDAHIDGLPFNDFDVELGKGYFTKCAASATWVLEGNALTAGVPLALQAGWNLVSVPHPSSHYTAQTLLDAIAAQGGACSEVDRWLNGGWDAHINGLPFNDFPVEPYQGYFVRCSQPSSFAPNTAPDASARVAWPEPAAPPALEPVDQVAITDVLATNRRDVALAITWRTDQPSTGWVEYGATPELGQIAYDDRGEKAAATVHHVTLTGLAPDAPVYYKVHSGSALADDGGKPFQVATTSRVAPSAPATAYGQINTAEGAPAVGSVVIGRLVDKAGSRSEPLSALVDGWGYWVLSLPEIDCQQFELHLEIVDPSGVRAETQRSACQ